ncbi:MAG: bifunctional diaminohydroxyphosphoribosylaminopyrimidine deaminase/5-amino-6-(5-phosphoribosylamino)uracil reductase RibD, partial [Campylobacterota bacterium]|nr:bifunctional diaminohydroxyphosphoribosylaminopyrimidine deaminase/5-amino-6-(5-phosphoribosylamino)uracil reductase RibD [Campylobacterota bacterium]
MQINLDFYMNLAIDEAWKYQGLTYPNPAVGSVIVGEKFGLLSIEAHRRSGKPHAEINALRSAFFALTQNSEILEFTTSHDIHNYLLKNHNNIFTTCTIFVTLEPCNHIGKTPSCASLLKELNFKKIYIATPDLNAIASNGAKQLQNVEFGICERRALELLEPFKRWQQSRFIFFKWAFRLDGTIDGGAVSTKNSRVNVHQMRDVCDLLIIGGNTVRVDRPTLDARVIDGKAPDILIYSKSHDFDEDIPLFKIS